MRAFFPYRGAGHKPVSVSRERLGVVYRPRYINRKAVMTDDEKRLPAAFYRTAAGTEPVREWLRGLSNDDRRLLGYDIGLVEFGWPIGMPLC